MSLIDHTYFQKRLTAIPNLKEEVLQDLNDHIERYEPDYLLDVLGRDLKDDFEAGLNEEPIPQKWIDLRDGADFEYEEIKYRWRGFLNTGKVSAIAFNVMWYFVRNNNALFTGIGTVTSNSENSTRIDPSRRLVSLWNNMVEENEILEKFLLANESDYTNYAPFDTLTETINIYGI